LSVTLIVNNIPFDYPEQGEPAPWGEAATGWATEVTRVLNSVNGPADILESSATILNNQTVFQNIPGLFFDTAIVRSFIVNGNIYRTFNTSQEVSESFTIIGLNQGSAGWNIQIEGLGDAGISFNIDNGGQIQYKSSNLPSYISGLIKFRGTGILKT
jgi:hypothetical protein